SWPATRTRTRRRPARWRSAAEPDRARRDRTRALGPTHRCGGRSRAATARRGSTRHQHVSMHGREYNSPLTSCRPRRTNLRPATSERLDAESAAVPVVDLAGIDEVPEIAELVPAAIRERGELINGAALNYAPGEFVGSTGEAVGYDIDILAAIGAVLGLSTRTEAAALA